MAQNIPAPLINHLNAPVLAHLKDLSTHSDVAESFLAAVKPLGDVQVFCPDPLAYRYLLASTNGIIFGFAVGMDTIAFRLDARMKPRALATGAAACPACGKDWVAVLPLGSGGDWPAVDLQFWALKAYVYARETILDG